MARGKVMNGQETIEAKITPIQEGQEAQNETTVTPENPVDTEETKKSFLRKIGDKIIDADTKKQQKKAEKEEAKAKKQAEKTDAKAKGNGAGRALKVGAAIGAGVFVLGSIAKAVLDASASSNGSDAIQELPGEPVFLGDGGAAESEAPEQGADMPVEGTKEDVTSN